MRKSPSLISKMDVELVTEMENTHTGPDTTGKGEQSDIQCAMP